MALNGYRSAEDRACRLINVNGVFVTLHRTAPQKYDVYRDGKHLGSVFKLRSRWDWSGDGVGRVWRDMHPSRRFALAELVAKATAGQA